jgi:hypothetical protein
MPTYTLASTTGQTTTGFWGFTTVLNSEANLPNVNITGALNTTPTYLYPAIATDLTLWFDENSSSGTVTMCVGYTQGSSTAECTALNPSTTGQLYSRAITTPAGGWEFYMDRNIFYGFFTNGFNSYFGRADAGQAGEYAVNNIYAGTGGVQYSGVALTGSITCDLIPSAPTVSQIAPYSSNQLTISWTVPTDNGGQAITYYRIAYKKSVDTTWIYANIQDASLTREYTFKGLDSDTLYDIAVSAINGVCDAFNNATAPAGYNDLTYTTGTNGTAVLRTELLVKKWNGTAWVAGTTARRSTAVWVPASVKQRVLNYQGIPVWTS